MTFGENDFHISNGDSVGVYIGAHAGAGTDTLLTNPDIFSLGPLAPIDDPEGWDSLRLGYWEIVLGETPNTTTIWRKLLARRERLANAESIRLWLGPAPAESLLVGFVLHAFDILELNPRRLVLADFAPVFRAVGGPVPVTGLPRDYLRLMGPWRAMDEEMETCYRAIWRAATAPSPKLLLEFCDLDSPWPRDLKAGLRNWMAHYPAVKSGLGFWDEVLLMHCGTAPVPVVQTIAACFRHVSGLVDFASDAWLLYRLRRMADPSLAWPLLEILGDGKTLSRTSVRLTDAGIEVLNGDENAIVLNGIEDRIGGVKLGLGADVLWFFDGTTLIPAGRITG